MRIQQLPIALANQIAAGEVIERPASVVKELLENSFDAQASQIIIDIVYGGFNQVRISDNGQGIPAEDLPLAIAPHATSKISQLKDLYSIASMGFRGEALASIASISRLSLSSKPPGQEHAMMLLTEGGEAINLRPCARNQGTTIDVRDLFFNTPVRKKFLKTERTEFQAIEMVVKRFALSAPTIAIQLNHNGKPLLHLPAANCDKTLLARIRKLMGKAFIEEAKYLEVEHAGLSLRGWLSTADYQRSQNDKQWLYVNSRMVKDKLLNHAIKQAYESLLYPGRHPSCLLYLTINPEEVDVNVHPTKHEVRFQQPRLVHDFIASQIQQALHLPRPGQGYQLEVELEESTGLEIREPYIPVLHKSKKIEQSTGQASSWTALNASYAFLFLQDKPYLINVPAIQKTWLSSVLNAEPLPLASRPLLVPISYSFKPLKPEQIEAYKQALAQVGIDLDLLTAETLVVRSLPTILPHLEIKAFLAKLLTSPIPSPSQLIESLVAFQSFDAQQLGQEEREELIAYLQSLVKNKNNPWCKHLSLAACEELLNA